MQIPPVKKKKMMLEISSCGDGDDCCGLWSRRSAWSIIISDIRSSVAEEVVLRKWPEPVVVVMRNGK